MKRTLLLVMSLLLFLLAKGDDYTYLNIQKTDGTGISLDVDNVSLTFSDGYLVAGDTQIDIYELSKMFFSNDLLGDYAEIVIGDARQLAYSSQEPLNFKNVQNLKAYIATGYDKNTGTIWLTRIYDVPANTGILLMGEEGTYNVSITTASSSYYKNMLAAMVDGGTIDETTDDDTNYYLSDGLYGVGFYKVDGSVDLKANRAYLSVPTEIPAVGASGSSETIAVSSAGQVPYYSSQSLDFSDRDDIKAYTATGYDYSSGTIWLTRVKQVPAEVGILIMAPEGNYDIPTASVASVYGNMFKGSLEASTVSATETIGDVSNINYYLSDGTSGVSFYKVSDNGVNLVANRCYLQIPNQSTTASTRSASGFAQSYSNVRDAEEVIALPLFRGISGEADGATGIKDLTPSLSTSEGEYYNLQGQRVVNPRKGIYILNGKKVIIR